MEKQKLTRKKRIAIIVVAAFLLSVAVYWYYGEYSVRNDHEDFIVAFDIAMHNPHRFAGDINIIETTTFQRKAVVFFNDRSENFYGIAYFERGLNMRYRLLAYSVQTRWHTTFVEVEWVLGAEQEYILIIGYNCNDVYAYGLQLHDYTVALPWRSVLAEVTFPVESANFIKVLCLNSLFNQAGVSREELTIPTLWPFHAIRAVLYDEHGNDITETFFKTDKTEGGGFSAVMFTNFFLRVGILFFIGLCVATMIWKWPKEDELENEGLETEDLETDTNKKLETQTL